MAAIGSCACETEGKRNVTEAINQTAARLGNRPATCRSYYVHPAILESYFDGSLVEAVRAAQTGGRTAGGRLHPEEECVMGIIRKKSADVHIAVRRRAA